MSIEPGTDHIVGTYELARMYGRSPRWARMLLDRWYAEQEAGGEVRVVAYRDTRNRLVLKTTRATLQRHMPPARDLQLVRKVEQIDRDLDFLATRIDRLMDLERRLERTEALMKKILPSHRK